MRNIILLVALCMPMLSCSTAQAEVQLPVAYSYWIQPDIEIVLTPMKCDGGPDAGYVAEAHNREQGKHAHGCWRESVHDTVQIWLEPDDQPRNYIDLVLYKSKFKPVYAM